MLQNKDIETLRMLFSSHNYVMTTAELTASKLYYADIKQLLDEGLIERVRRGYYHWTQDYGESEVVIINRLFPDAVLCMETALFYYRYSDRNPAEWNFAIDKNVSKRRTKIDYPFIKAYRVESELVTLGETEGEIDFHKVRIYDRDRTICDVLRNMNKIDEKIRDVWKQIKTIEEKFISSKALVSKREKVNYAKARIALYAEMSSSGIFETVDGDIEELKEKIARLEEKIKGFDVDKKMSKAESFLSNNMNRLSLTLDFEEEYRPIDLNFGLTDGSFDIYQHQKSNENIHLYEMGSGANWVSCHIALFLSFLRFFATQDNSPMPLVMFFDQPSQVYFPQGNDKDEITQADLIAVNKMYKTIFDEINSIGEDTGILPQIIIVDHVDGKNLECKEEFERYIRCNWRNDTGLI